MLGMDQRMPRDIVTVGRDIAARQLDMCGNYGQLFSLLDRHSVERAFLCKNCVGVSKTNVL
jgi:hypothetical protein